MAFLWLFFNGRLKQLITFKTGCHFSPSAFESIILNFLGRHRKRANLPYNVYFGLLVSAQATPSEPYQLLSGTSSE